MMLLQSGKRRIILSLLMPVCPQSSNQAIKSGQPSLPTTHIHQWHLGQVITMESPVGQEGLTGTHPAGTKAVGGIRTVEGKVVAMAVALTLNKVEDRLLTLAVAQGVVAAVVAMVQVLQTFHKPVRMALAAQAGGQIIPHKLAPETSSSSMGTGNSM